MNRFANKGVMENFDEFKEDLMKVIPEEAKSAIPGDANLTAIKQVYISERLNEVFGLGSWFLDFEEIAKQETECEKTYNNGDTRQWTDYTVVLKVVLTLDGKEYIHFGTSKNSDIGNAYKGALSNGMCKIACTYLNVGLEVYKGEDDNPQQNDYQQKKKNYGNQNKNYNNNAQKASSQYPDGKNEWFNEKEFEMLENYLHGGHSPEELKQWISGYKVSRANWARLRQINSDLV